MMRAALLRAQGRPLEIAALPPPVPVRTEVPVIPLEEVNEALARLREGRQTGAAVIVP